MLMSRKEMNEAISKLRETMDARTDVELLYNNVDSHLANYKAYIAEPGRTAVEVSAAFAPVKSAANLYNALMKWHRLDILGAMKPADSFADFLSTQCVTGIKVEMNKKTGAWEIVDDESVCISPSDYYANLYKSSMPLFEDMVCIFADNVYRMAVKAKGIDDDAITKFTADDIHQTFLDIRDRLGWTIDTDKLSWNAMSRQLNELAGTLSFGYTKAAEIKLINCDCKYVGFGLIATKNKANQNGGFIVRKTSTIIDLIFRAIYTRNNGEAYSTEIQTGGKNQAQTVKANKSMSESSKNAQFAKNATPEAGPVKCPDAVEPKPKKGTKKSTKKEAAAK